MRSGDGGAESNSEKRTCPLCLSESMLHFSRDKHRNYYQCRRCSLVHVPSQQFLSLEDEKKRYDLHRNSPDDPGYSGFLSRMFTHLRHSLPPASNGLDFGCGPVPLLSTMFLQAGHSVTLFDFFYNPDASVFEKQYDFITATEVVEHLREPGKELERLWACLKPGGRLGIMTKPLVDQERFPQWHYKNDPTHICFYSHATFAWLGLRWDAEATFAESDIVLFHKKS